ncbi:hypothetical protein INR49_013241 [Caranx melampygus]|nr:hypothetical protein INR49_013241 [Caranx melampygus]
MHLNASSGKPTDWNPNFPPQYSDTHNSTTSILTQQALLFSPYHCTGIQTGDTSLFSITPHREDDQLSPSGERQEPFAPQSELSHSLNTLRNSFTETYPTHFCLSCIPEAQTSMSANLSPTCTSLKVFVDSRPEYAITAGRRDSSFTSLFKEKTDPVPLVKRGRAFLSLCLEINRKYLTVHRKLFEALLWHHACKILGKLKCGQMCHLTDDVLVRNKIKIIINEGAGAREDRQNHLMEEKKKKKAQLMLSATSRYVLAELSGNKLVLALSVPCELQLQLSFGLRRVQEDGAVGGEDLPGLGGGQLASGPHQTHTVSFPQGQDQAEGHGATAATAAAGWALLCSFWTLRFDTDRTASTRSPCFAVSRPEIRYRPSCGTVKIPVGVRQIHTPAVLLPATLSSRLIIASSDFLCLASSVGPSSPLSNQTV